MIFVDILQAGSSHVHGVAIPTIDGIRNVLDHIGAQKNGKQKQVVWINLREEPVSSGGCHQYCFSSFITDLLSAAWWLVS